MRNMNTGSNLAACLAATVLLGASASAQEVIYENTTGGLNVVSDQGTAQIGDMVSFAGSARTVTEFAFEYYVNPSASGNESFQVFIRNHDGSGGFPGSVIYDSGLLNTATITGGLDENGFGTFRATGLSLEVPESVTWSVAFSGFEAGEGGLRFAGDAEVGMSPRFDNGTFGASGSDFYLRMGNEGWEVLTQGELVENFAASFTAVPEPSTWALLIGGLATFGFIRRRK